MHDSGELIRRLMQSDSRDVHCYGTIEAAYIREITEGTQSQACRFAHEVGKKKNLI